MPHLMKWLSRDPDEEISGRNLYVFIQNGAIDSVDFLGRYAINLIPHKGDEYNTSISKVHTIDDLQILRQKIRGPSFAKQLGAFLNESIFTTPCDATILVGYVIDPNLLQTPKKGTKYIYILSPFSVV